MLFYPEYAETWFSIKTAVNNAKRVFITTHVNPDGDAIGSEMALYRFLNGKGYTVRVVNASKTPEIYSFLDPDGVIETLHDEQSHITDPPCTDDIVIFLDMGVLIRAGNTITLLIAGKPATAMIDHHIPEHAPVDIAAVNHHAESTGSLVYDFIRSVDPDAVTQAIAESVLVAIVTDSGYFTYSNTTSLTLRIAATLYDHGVSARDLRRRLEAMQPLCRQRLLGLCLAETQVSACGRVAWSHVTTEMFDNTGSKREHTDGIINEIRIVEGISVAMLIIQEETNTWKLSFRSMSGIPVNYIAGKLGGGGHEKAAGATLHGSYDDVVSKALSTIALSFDEKQ